MVRKKEWITKIENFKEKEKNNSSFNWTNFYVFLEKFKEVFNKFEME